MPSGNGGYITVNGDRLDINKWEHDNQSKNVENTHSGTEGATNFDHVVEHNEWSIAVPWDETNTPEDVSLVRGDKVDIVFQYGATGNSDTLTNTLVTSVKTVNDNQGDIIRVDVTGKGGKMT